MLLYPNKSVPDTYCNITSKLTKLDVIDFGIVSDNNDSLHPGKHIFFVGKIFINSIGLPAFVSLFVIIMD